MTEPNMRAFGVSQWYQWYTNIVQGFTNGTIGNTICTNGNAYGTIGSPNGTIGTIGKPMVSLVSQSYHWLPHDGTIGKTRKSALRGTYTPGWCPFLSINIF